MSKDGLTAAPAHLGCLIFHLPHSQGLQGPLRPRTGQSPIPIRSWNSVWRGRGDGPGHWAVRTGTGCSVLAFETISRSQHRGSAVRWWCFPTPAHSLGVSWEDPCPCHSPERGLPRRTKPFFAVEEGYRTPFAGPVPVWVRGRAGDGHQDREAHFHLL